MGFFLTNNLKFKQNIESLAINTCFSLQHNTKVEVVINKRQTLRAVHDLIA